MELEGSGVVESPVVYDISSDEEGEELGGGGGGGGGRNEVKNGWLSELLVGDDIKVADDVMIIAGNSEGMGLVYGKKRKFQMEDDDDDCYILDVDPDKPVEVLDDGSGGNGNGDGSDELAIIGEKGQIACRDYPHPRHLCATFSFVTTAHEKYCSLCHCYVCDSPAPCSHWGTGISEHDHCHSTDKAESWKVLRGKFKMAKSSPQFLHITATSMTPLQHTKGINSYQNNKRPVGNFIDRAKEGVVNPGQSSTALPRNISGSVQPTCVHQVHRPHPQMVSLSQAVNNALPQLQKNQLPPAAPRYPLPPAQNYPLQQAQNYTRPPAQTYSQHPTQSCSPQPRQHPTHNYSQQPTQSYPQQPVQNYYLPQLHKQHLSQTQTNTLQHHQRNPQSQAQKYPFPPSPRNSLPQAPTTPLPQAQRNTQMQVQRHPIPQVQNNTLLQAYRKSPAHSEKMPLQQAKSTTCPPLPHGNHSELDKRFENVGVSHVEIQPSASEPQVHNDPISQSNEENLTHQNLPPSTTTPKVLDVGFEWQGCSVDTEHQILSDSTYSSPILSDFEMDKLMCVDEH